MMGFNGGGGVNGGGGFKGEELADLLLRHRRVDLHQDLLQQR